MKQKTDIRIGLLQAGVKNLKEFGYPDVSQGTILTDKIYREFFKSMLRDTKGRSSEIDAAIDSLLVEIDA